MSAPVVSVVVPVYNGEAHLAPCLDSIAAQSLQAVQIICVDDGSTDGTGAILDAFARRDSRFQVIRRPNGGPGTARNVGLALAEGKYLIFLDADDLFEPDLLVAMVEKAEQTGADAVICRADAFDSATGAALPCDHWMVRQGAAQQDCFAPGDIATQLFQFTIGWPWDKLLRTDFVRRSGIVYPDLPNSEDGVFVFPLLAMAERIAITGAVLVHHRMNVGGSVSDSRARAMDAPWLAFGLTRDHLEQKGLLERYEASLLRWAMGFLIWHMSTLPEGSSQRQCYEKLKREWFPQMGFDKYPRSNYEKKDYEKYRLIRALPYGAYSLLRSLEGGSVMFQWLKNLLKRIFPPPVYAFNREVERILAAVEQTHKRGEGQIRRMETQNAALQKQIEELQKGMEALQKQLAEQNIALQKQLEVQAKQLESQQRALTVLTQEQQMTATLATEVKAARYQAYQAARHSEEGVWAAVFNDTIARSPWLKDKTFSPGRWAVGYPYLYAMYRVLNESSPKRILEFGLGQSTRMIAQYAAAFDDVEHIVVEQDPAWVEFFRRNFQLSSQTEIVTLDYEMTPYKDTEAVRVFAGFRKVFAERKFDFICIDAPLGGDMPQYARIDVLRLLPGCVGDDYVIMIDDCNRPGELGTVKEMEAILTQQVSGCKRGLYRGEKDCILLASESRGFLTTM